MVSNLLKGIDKIMKEVDVEALKNQPPTSHSRELSASFTPGYLNVKLFESMSYCDTNAADTSSEEGVYAIVGIPIGICIPGPTGTSFKIGYSEVPATVANISTVMYDFWIDVYVGSCLFSTGTQQVPQDDMPPLPQACLDYEDFSEVYYNNTLNYNVDMAISTTFSSVQTPWETLPMGEFSFLYTSSSQCLDASGSTAPGTSTGAIFNWVTANVCIDGAYATCGGTNNGNSITVTAYASPVCDGSISSSETFQQILCASYSQGESSEMEEILEMFGVQLPEINDDAIFGYLQAIQGTTYCGNWNALTQPTLSPTPAPTTTKQASSNSDAMSSTEMTETVVGSLFGAAVVIGVFVVLIFYRAQVKRFFCMDTEDNPKRTKGYREFEDAGIVKARLHTAPSSDGMPGATAIVTSADDAHGEL